MDRKKESTRHFSRWHRILHWATFFALSVLFLTGFLRMTWMDKRRMGGVINQSTENLVSLEDALNVAKAIRASMWEWHLRFAFIMVVVFIARLIYMAMHGTKFPGPFKAGLSVKRRIESMTYVLFYFFLGIQIFTGFFHLWAESTPLRHQLTVIHKWALYWFPIFILIHFLGFILSEICGEKGIVSKMIGGSRPE